MTGHCDHTDVLGLRRFQDGLDGRSIGDTGRDINSFLFHSLPNQLRVLLSALAYSLLERLRNTVLVGKPPGTGPL